MMEAAEEVRNSGFSAEELELLAYLLDQDAEGSPRPRGIPRGDRIGGIPLSFAQERMWFLDQLEPGSPARKMSLSLRFEGPLDERALERSLHEVIRRHEVLRTTFCETDGKPVQVIAPAPNVELPLIDLLEHPAPERPAIAHELVNEIARQPFDLAQGPLLRATLIRLDDAEHLLFLRLHHIVFDGWSAAILRREISLLYDAFSSGKPSPLPELPIQYADYAIWQRNRLQQGELDEQLSYWIQQLEGAPPTSELPADYPRPPVQTYRGAHQYLELPEDLTHALKDLGRRESATLFMTLMAAFKALVSRLSGQKDIVFGTPIAGRNHSDLEGLVGCFLNSLVLRTDLSGDPTFLELLRRVRETALGAYDHQDVPFEKLLEELQPERDLSRTPFFQIFFNMLNLEGSPLAESGPGFSLVRPRGVHSNFDLTAYIREARNHIRLAFVFSADLFSEARMAELINQYHYLLTQIVESPSLRLSELSLVTPQARTILPDPTLPLSEDWQGAIHSRLASHAREAPDYPAVLDADERWTYNDLDLATNRLANYLRAGGLQSQDIVAIYGHRSAALVWAILGVLKAGAAFLILDPAYPPDRLIDYLLVAQPRGWIQIKAAGRLPSPIQTYLDSASLSCQVTLPSKAEAQSLHLLDSYPTDDPGLLVGPDDLASVAFTSGSTGTPKAVLGRHGPLTHFLPWQQQVFAISPADRFSMLSGLSHDPLQRDIFTPLWAGATICVPEDDTIGTPSRLAQWMARERITFAHLTPAMSQILTETASPGSQLPALRHAFFVGDQLTRTDVQQITTLAPNVTCTNSYGSTETQRAVGYFTIPPQTGQDRAKAVYPLGSGMPGAQLLVLTDHRALAGVGELGEIHVRSPHLARGYLGDESLTCERFLRNPFTGLEHDRLYRTGDLGRYLPDGSVEFAGRNDQQVKIRGFRIELGEIEAVLRQHDSLQDAAVLPWEDPSGQKRLVAYIVPVDQPATATTDLRNYLGTRLPDFMVPSAFVTLDALPLTPNRKIDRRALPRPDQIRQDVTDGYAPPRDDLELQLTQIWEEVLGIQPIGVRDSFFALGGHSLLGVRLFARIAQTFGTTLPLATLFRATTVEQLAVVLRGSEAREKAKWSSLVAIQPSGTNPPLFAVPGNLGNVLVDLGHLGNYLGKDQPFFGLQDWTGNPARIEALAASYLEEIRTVQAGGPFLLAGVCSGAVVALEMAQQLKARGEEVALLAMVEPPRPFGPGRSDYKGFVTAVSHQLRRRLRRYARRLIKKRTLGQREILRLKIKVVANRWALRRYKPRPYPGRIDLFLTEASLRYPHNRQLAWRDFAEGGAHVHEIPGNHATIVGLADTRVDEAHMGTLASKLRVCIDEALKNR